MRRSGNTSANQRARRVYKYALPHHVGVTASHAYCRSAKKWRVQACQRGTFVRLIGPNVDPPVWDCPAFGATTIHRIRSAGYNVCFAVAAFKSKMSHLNKTFRRAGAWVRARAAEGRRAACEWRPRTAGGSHRRRALRAGVGRRVRRPPPEGAPRRAVAVVTRPPRCVSPADAVWVIWGRACVAARGRHRGDGAGGRAAPPHGWQCGCRRRWRQHAGGRLRASGDVYARCGKAVTHVHGVVCVLSIVWFLSCSCSVLLVWVSFDSPPPTRQPPRPGFHDMHKTMSENVYTCQSVQVISTGRSLHHPAHFSTALRQAPSASSPRRPSPPLSIDGDSASIAPGAAHRVVISAASPASAALPTNGH